MHVFFYKNAVNFRTVLIFSTISSCSFLTLSLPRGTVKRDFKNYNRSCNFRALFTQLFTLTVRFWAHSKAKSLSFHFRVHKFAPGRGLRPLQPPGHYQQLPARNELRRRKENNFFPSLTKF